MKKTKMMWNDWLGIPFACATISSSAAIVLGMSYLTERLGMSSFFQMMLSYGVGLIVCWVGVAVYDRIRNG